MNVYDFFVKLADGSTAPLKQYVGMVSLIVNTASLCSYATQLPGLERLFCKYRDCGFVVLLFPSNQLHALEPGYNAEIQYVYRSIFHITAPVFAEINVNGPVSDRLYRHLTESKRFDRDSVIPEEMETLYREIDVNYQTSSDIKWNFTKFLVGRDGKVISRFEPEVTPRMLEADIIEALGQLAAAAG